MNWTSRVLACAVFFLASSCKTIAEIPPELPNDFYGIPLNGGRTQAIAVSPTNRNEVVIATQFGGLWRTFNGGQNWKHLDKLSEVFVHDVEFGADGSTLVATVGRTNHEDHHGGIWVSHDHGNSWFRPRGSRLPASTRLPNRTVAKGISRDPDNGQRFFVGTDFGIAITDDNGNSWRHVEVDPAAFVESDRLQQSVHSILSFPGPTVLAMTRHGIFRSDLDGASGSWTKVRNEGFGFYDSVGWSKMDRSPYAPYAFIMRDYDTLYLYELDTGRWTQLKLPEKAASRGPFVRVGRFFFPGYITIWVGQGTRALRVTRRSLAALRGLSASDWGIFGRGEGVHDDMGDLGLDVSGRAVMIGSDGGVFRPDPENGGKWISAARPGSGMNSLLMTDITSVNVTHNGALRPSSVQFATQDNGVWGSTDSGSTFPTSDCCEGFHVEGQGDARVGQDVTIAYGRVGAGFSGIRMSKPGLINQRNVSDDIAGGGTYKYVEKDADGNDITLTQAAEAFYLKPGYWLRLRSQPGVDPQIVVSTNNGASWRTRFNLTVSPAGVIQRTRVNDPVSYVKAYLPVTDGTMNPDGISSRVGLLRMSNIFANSVGTYGNLSVHYLPDNGSLGVRATEFDWQAVFGANPVDWRHVIAPDIVNGRIMVTRDGFSWTTDSGLTTLATDYGRLRLWDNGAYYMQVTSIAFDPYRPNRILVGTRDAGIICSNDGGQTWGRIPDSRRMLYVTGFTFHPIGSTRVATYGRGMWQISPSRDACVGGRPRAEPAPPWARTDPHFTVGSLLADIPGPPGPVPGIAPDQDAAAPIPPDPPRPRMIVDTSVTSTSGIVLGEDNRIDLTLVGFDAAQPVEVSLDGKAVPLRGGKSENGRMHYVFVVPADMPQGAHRLIVKQRSGSKVSTLLAIIRKVQLDEHLGKDKASEGPPFREPTLAELERIEAQFANRPSPEPAEPPVQQ